MAMSELITKALKAIRQHRDTIEEQIDALTAQRRELENERNRVQFAPVPRADVLTAFERTIDIWEGDFRERVTHALQGGRTRSADGNLFMRGSVPAPDALAEGFNLLAIDHNGARGEMRDVSTRCLLGLLAPQLRQLVQSVVAGIDLPDKGMPVSERRDRLAAIEREIGGINGRIRELVNQAAEAGLDIG